MSQLAGHSETPVWIRSDGDELMAIVTRPAHRAGMGVLLLSGGGWMPSTHRNRMYVDLARSLATVGCTVVRIDYRGVGESTGTTAVFDFMQPHRSDALAAASLLRQLEPGRIVVVGTCYGGRTALAAVPEIGPLAGLVLSGVPVQDYQGAEESVRWHAKRAWSWQTVRNLPKRYPKYLRMIKSRLLSADDPISHSYRRGLARSLEGGCRVLFLEGTHDKHHAAFQRARSEALKPMYDFYGDQIELKIIEGELHGELWPEAQDFTREAVLDFVAGLIDSEHRSTKR